MRTVAIVLMLAAVAGCGKDEPDFEDLDGQIGNVPGNFDVRLAQLYREKVDALQARLDALMPGLTAELTQRFAGEDAETEPSGSRLSDLFKIKLPGTESEFINKRIYNELVALKGDEGPYFDVVDTEKYLKGPDSYTPPTAVDDPKVVDQYHLEMIGWEEAVESEGFDQRLANAAPVVAAVLDTGVLATHEDLADVMWSYRGNVGYDAASGAALTAAASVDKNGHGTHVAGIIAATGKNGKGVHGVGFVKGREGDPEKPLTEIMNIRVLNDNGAGTSDVISRGIKWAVDQHWAQKADAAEGRADQKLIINMSLGGPFDVEGYDVEDADADGHPDFVDDLLNYAASKGDVLIVVAAGNETCGISGACDMYGESYRKTYYYPCSYKNVLCVAASTHEEKLAGFSNRLASVGIAAPGYQIISTIPESESSYGYYSGTSQATPVVAGAAALLWGLHPDLTANDVKQILQKSSAKIPEIKSAINGNGRLDLAAAFAYAAELEAQGKRPADLDPSSVSSEKRKPTNSPDTTNLDPDAPSPNSNGNVPADRGKGSAQGMCAVAAGSTSGSWFLFVLGVLAPLVLGRRVRLNA